MIVLQLIALTITLAGASFTVPLLPSCRRLEYKPHLIRWEEIEEEAVTGKQYIYPAKCKKVSGAHTPWGRPVAQLPQAAAMMGKL